MYSKKIIVRLFRFSTVNYHDTHCVCIQFATGMEAVVIGKPSKTFFMSALEDLKSSPENV